MLTLEKLSGKRGDVVLFRDMNVQFAPGTVWMLQGANGSGKTTLLKILAGILKPAEGKIKWEGEDAHTHADFLSSFLYIGHENAIKLEMSVEQNIRFYAAIHGTCELVPSALNYFELESMASWPCHRLSAGWKRRVALAKLVAVPSLIWLLDEPFAHLDVAATKLVYALMLARVNQGGIIIAANHGESQISPCNMLELSGFGGKE